MDRKYYKNLKALDNLKTDSVSVEMNEVQITKQGCGIDKSPIENDCELRITPGESCITKNSTPPICSAISYIFSTHGQSSRTPIRQLITSRGVTNSVLNR